VVPVKQVLATREVNDLCQEQRETPYERVGCSIKRYGADTMALPPERDHSFSAWRETSSGIEVHEQLQSDAREVRIQQRVLRIALRLFDSRRLHQISPLKNRYLSDASGRCTRVRMAPPL